MRITFKGPSQAARMLGFFGPFFLACSFGWAAEASSLTASNVHPSPTASSDLKKQEVRSFLKEIPAEQKGLSLIAGTSHLLRFSKKIGRIAVSDPQVLDFLILNGTEVLLNAKKEGAVNLMVWDLEEQVSAFDIRIHRDTRLLEEILRKIDPKGHFEIFPSKDVLVVKGNTTSVEKVKQIEKAANAFAEGSVSLVQIKEAKQILLKARFIQIDRTNDFDFGMDFEFDRDNPRNNILQRFLPGATTAATGGDSSATFITPALTADFFDRNDTDVYQILSQNNRDIFMGFLKAVEERGLVKTIARPNLLAKDGEEATFLVGGEAAVVVSTEDSVNVQYKEFGTRLKFTPEIIGEKKIRLTVEPEVSSLNSANGVNIGNTQIPGFSTTRAKTIVELYEEETFVLGGLLQQSVQKIDRGVPFLRRLPLIGKAFQSMDYDLQNTELLVLVTPKILGPERSPVLEKAPEHDILSKAVQLGPPLAIGDENSQAIQQYLKENKRYLPGKTAAGKGPVPVRQVELKSPARPKEEAGGKAKSLDQLEAELRWS